jgi:type VI secretion system secreted protein Hcp
MFMHYGDILGDSTAEGHKGSDGWVEITSFKFGVNREVSAPTGGSADRESSAPTVREVIITKPADSSSIGWMDAILEGEGVDAVIDFCKTDKKQLEVYQYYVLNNAMVTDYDVSTQGDRPTETITISFTKFLYGFNRMDATNAEDNNAVIGYDVGQAKVV